MRGDDILSRREDRFLQHEREDTNRDAADRVVPKIADLFCSEEEHENE